jgi:hypothetical protein
VTLQAPGPPVGFVETATCEPPTATQKPADGQEIADSAEPLGSAVTFPAACAVGRVVVTMLPRLSSATQSDFVGHDTAVNVFCDRCCGPINRGADQCKEAPLAAAGTAAAPNATAAAKSASADRAWNRFVTTVFEPYPLRPSRRRTQPSVPVSGGVDLLAGRSLEDLLVERRDC